MDLARAARHERRPALPRRASSRWRATGARPLPIGCRDFALDAWNARAVATRLVQWAVAGSLLGLRAGDPDADWLGREIGLHGLFLRDNLELDLRGNHLFRDAVGLVFANELAGGIPDALAWLEHQVAEQVLPDGGHVERAPFYHAVCARRTCSRRALLLGDASPAWLDDALGRMAGFLDAIALGDGEIPLLGRRLARRGRHAAAARGCARRRSRPCRRRRPSAHSGLVPLRAGRWRAVVRAGRARARTSRSATRTRISSRSTRAAGAVRVVTDTGTLLYDAGPERQRIRGTAAHNTLRSTAPSSSRPGAASGSAAAAGRA